MTLIFWADAEEIASNSRRAKAVLSRLNPRKKPKGNLGFTQRPCFLPGVSRLAPMLFIAGYLLPASPEWFVPSWRIDNTAEANRPRSVVSRGHQEILLVFV
jgi:hypothetical protein